MHRTASSSPKPSFPRSYAPVLRYRSGMLVEEHLPVICESHLDIVVNGKLLATLLCSHVHLRELACGFLYNEEVIEEAKEIVACLIDPHESVARIEVARPVAQSSPVVRSSGFGGTVLPPTPHPRARNDPLEPPPCPCLDSVVEAVRRMRDQAT